MFFSFFSAVRLSLPHEWSWNSSDGGNGNERMRVRDLLFFASSTKVEYILLAVDWRELDFCMCQGMATVLRSWIEWRRGGWGWNVSKYIVRIYRIQCEHLNARSLLSVWVFTYENGNGGSWPLDRHQLDEFSLFFFFFFWSYLLSPANIRKSFHPGHITLRCLATEERNKKKWQLFAINNNKGKRNRRGARSCTDAFTHIYIVFLCCWSRWRMLGTMYVHVQCMFIWMKCVRIIWYADGFLLPFFFRDEPHSNQGIAAYCNRTQTHSFTSSRSRIVIICNGLIARHTSLVGGVESMRLPTLTSTNDCCWIILILNVNETVRQKVWNYSFLW